MPDTTSTDLSTDLSPDFSPDDFGPPAGCVDALASWRRVLAALDQLARTIDRVDVALGEVQVDLGAQLDRESSRVDG
ncbi:hypothetical protein L6R46_22625 [Myxococcota bacterium]|nr:hypothetical protein [Myxococcota bacterium]